MADRRKGKKKKESDARGEEDKPSNVEYEVAKYMRSKLPQKRTTLIGHKVEYFISAKAIDCLLDSKWATNKDKVPAIFTTRDLVADFLETMLRHKFFHRARKIIVKNEPKKKKTDQEVESSAAEDVKEKKARKKKAVEQAADKSGEKAAVTGEITTKDAGEGKVEKKKEKKKVKLDMHLEQIVIDGNEPYVWIYDPIPLKAWFIGLGLVFGAVAICPFPLWPRVVRNYVYYLSIAAAGFLFFIIGLAVLRLIVFCLVWAVTFGKHHLWLLPNLTEDVGFVQSFIPSYQYDYMGDKKEEEEEKAGESSKNGTKKDDSGGEAEKADTSDSSQKDKEDVSEDSSENGSQTAANGSDNGFEMLDVADEATEPEQRRDQKVN